MKTCPHCKELLGDNVKVCFNCNYNFELKRVMGTQEISENRQKEKEAQEELYEQDRIRQQEQQHQYEEDWYRNRELQEHRQTQLSKNPQYEYDVVAINDLSTGAADMSGITFEINRHAKTGWQLKHAFTNEIGKSSSAVAVNFFGTSVNATIDQTILIFERCIKPGEK